MSHFIYILECSNGSLYTGYTTDIERRYKEHVAGSLKCKYTRSFPPVKLCACWEASSLSLALKAEKFIKTRKKADKLQLIEDADNLAQHLKKLGMEIPLTKKSFSPVELETPC